MGKVRDMLVCGAAALIGSNGAAAADDARTSERLRMVEQQLAARDINDSRGLAAMRKIPRHRFVPAREQRYAYADSPLPIGEDQTISQPYIVALMTQLLLARANARALEVG